MISFWILSGRSKFSSGPWDLLKSVKSKVAHLARAARDGRRCDSLGPKMSPLVPPNNSPRRKPIRLTQATRRLWPEKTWGGARNNSTTAGYP